MKLVELSHDLRDSFLNMVRDYEENDFNEYKNMYQRASDWGEEEFNEYIDELDRWKKRIGLNPNQIPTTRYFMIDSERNIKASGILRFPLNDRCQMEGGNIGYGVPPSHRGKGYASLFLSLCLIRAKEVGLEKVLLTCNKDNFPSVKVIEKNGGVLQDYVESVEKGNEGNQVARYWIDLTD